MEDAVILGKALQFVSLAEEALVRAGTPGEETFAPTDLSIHISVNPRGSTFLLLYRVTFGSFSIHHGFASIDQALHALEHMILNHGAKNEASDDV